MLFALFPPDPNVPTFETSWKLNATTSYDQKECIVLSTPLLAADEFLLRTSPNTGTLLFPSRRRKNRMDAME